jgi:hypothetical protein
VLLWLSWTQLSGQTLVLGNDTVQCYTLEELRVITFAVVSGSECDSLLDITESEVLAYKAIIANYEELMINKQLEIDTQKLLTDDYKHAYAEMTINFEDEVRAHKKTRFIWGLSIGALIGIGTLIVVN